MKRFDIAAGQPTAWSILSRSFRAGRVASTYLLYGPEGVGAWALALEFTALLNCESPATVDDTPRPCGSCRHCRLIFALNFEGLYPVVPIAKHKNEAEAVQMVNDTLDAKREEPFAPIDRSESVTIPIELARETKRKLSIQAAAGITRVALFYQMERMRMSSADALLKMIEEPPSNTVIILTAPRPETLAETIQSRAQRIRLERLPEPMVVEYLKEEYSISEKAATLAARICDGSLGRALQVVAEDDGTERDDRSVGLMLFKTLMTRPASELIQQMNELLNYRDRGAAEDLIRLWQSLVRDGAYLANTSDEKGLINVDFAAETRALSHLLSQSGTVEAMVTATKNTLADLPRNVHIQAALVAMALKLKGALKSGGGAAAPGEKFG